MSESYLTIRDAASLLGVSYSYLWKRIKEGAVPVVRLSPKCIRLRLSDVNAWLHAPEISRSIREKIKASHEAATDSGTQA